MKLVDILARELKVWPDGAVTAVQDLDGEVKFDNSDEMPRINKSKDVWVRRGDWGDSIHPQELAEDCSYAIVTKPQWQAAVDALKDAEPSIQVKDKNIVRSNDDLAVLVASKVFYRFGNLFWGESIRRKDLVGKLAGSVSSTDGYRYVKCGKARNRVAVHRVIFLMHHGYLPEVIDHINRIRDDNRIENLRDAVTEGNNQGNQSHQVGRGSKYKGVCWDEARGKWSAYAKKDGKRFNLGRFSSEQQAALAYNAKAAELFGEFANLNHVRTPEQIEAEEIADIEQWLDSNIEDLRTISKALHKAGYRKFEIVES